MIMSSQVANDEEACAAPSPSIPHNALPHMNTPNKEAEPNDAPHSIFSTTQKRWIASLASFGAMFSTLSSYVYFPALVPMASDFDVSVTLINLTVTSYLIVAGVAPAFMGDIADQRGRRPAYLLMYMLVVVANLGIALVKNYPGLFVLRMIQSAGASGSYGAAYGVIADVTTLEERGGYVGIIIFLLDISALCYGRSNFVLWNCLQSGRLLDYRIKSFTATSSVVGSPSHCEGVSLGDTEVEDSRVSMADGHPRESDSPSTSGKHAPSSKRKNNDSPGNDISDFPIEEARFTMENSLILISVASTVGYGVSLMMRAFLTGAATSSLFTMCCTILTDLNPDRPATVQASYNLIRCIGAGAGIASQQPLLDAVGSGWCFAIYAVLLLLGAPLVWVLKTHGMSWRKAEKIRRSQSAHNAAGLLFLLAMPNFLRHLPPCSNVRGSQLVGRPSLQSPAIRSFHDYFITHIPSSSMHPDSRTRAGPHHKLPRDKSVPHNAEDKGRLPAAMVGASREMTVVRIPIRSAKHHFGASLSRGTRPYNEDAFQAGTIEIPAFARRRPMSLTRSSKDSEVAAGSVREGGDPQVFYFGVFDGHGGSECSNWLREQLHLYVEEGAGLFELESTLNLKDKQDRMYGWLGVEKASKSRSEEPRGADVVDFGKGGVKPSSTEVKEPKSNANEEPPETNASFVQSDNIQNAEELEKQLVHQWKELVGGYYRRFKPEFFSEVVGGQGHTLSAGAEERRQPRRSSLHDDQEHGLGLETVLEYAFLKADYDFVSAQAAKKDEKEDSVAADRAINADDVLHNPFAAPKNIGGPQRFRGGSTCSIALVSTPTPSPFWHPASPSTIITAHCGDTRILLCSTSTGQPVPLTTNHHPSDPHEAARMRRYAATFVTDSFGEERVSGLANTRAFGDIASKRIGVSAEPEVRRIEVAPAEYSFMVLMSDGVSGQLEDQEVLDIVKEAKTPEQGARDVVTFATAITNDADNATCLVVRLGGWERRSEGGLGSMGTKEMRDWKKTEAESPRGRRG
ncbi:protein serine/threonine phosphatase 2C [Pseudovirgaria hyperparasitica]|uniref:Protein serine/threonine phosphatase 2C n=1 Tax=Pseudovirgaria hyperparasitica TaxID=470096 RepID=A0A6A6W330_9PEZI|nr:protein serine/threonine phosphatase 2C [Pseudovirgaria hyperparasitica]KAF2756965.1 protein serine/threonine phosphatase 2C [Pseudovirgaria hyperparasitica]